jgi:SAM-dependent methyltransferase
MDETRDQPSMEDLITTLYPLMPGEDEKTNRSQLKHRFDLLQSWYGGLPSITQDLRSATVLEIGCGQGDMTIPLAHFAKRVDAIDPAPLDYGSPFTLGEAQATVSRHFGDKIRWIQQDPIEYMSSQEAQDSIPDVVVLAHSIFYFASEDYLARLLRQIRSLASGREAGSTRLVVAEWGMRASNPAAEAHVLAAKAQGVNPLPDGNVRVVITPEKIKEIALGCDWRLIKEHWVEAPDLDDGQWEVGLARETAHGGQTSPLLVEMERAVEKLQGGRAGAMDVWTAVFEL